MDEHSYCHTRTGYAPIDAIRYRREPMVEAFEHRDTGLLLYRMHSHGRPGEMTTAERDGNAPDMMFVSRGAGVAAHGHVAGKPFQLKPNTAIRSSFVPAGADASVTFGVAAYSINLLFPAGLLSRLVEGVDSEGFQPLLFTEDERLIRLVRMLNAEIGQPGFASGLMVEGLTRAIAALLARVDRTRIDAQADRIHLPAWKLRRVLEHVEAHLSSGIGLAELAAVAGLSPFHFSRVFKQATGTSPYHYVLERRLDRARNLLVRSRMSLAEMALECGFSNQSHFTAAFTRAMGMSPGRYRATWGV